LWYSLYDIERSADPAGNWAALLAAVHAPAPAPAPVKAVRARAPRRSSRRDRNAPARDRADDRGGRGVVEVRAHR
ncbi:MAG: hypothetical protein JWP17_693, partial [Solirubrobacterales bacterium]|nr:hypothetical protein [Solirubrobacterales bacterium]